MYNDKPKPGEGIKLPEKPRTVPKPEIETEYGTFGVGRVQGKPGITYRKTFRGLNSGGKVSSGSSMRKFGTGSTGGKSADMGGRPMPKQAKVGKVMREFKAGKLKSSSGQKVTNPKQAMAIGLSEAGISKPKKGSEMKYSKGGMAATKMGAVKTAAPSRDGVAMKGKTKGKKVVMPGGKGMKTGGMTKMRKGGAC